MALLEPLNVGVDAMKHEEWHAGDALSNIFFGAALGAGAHVALGGLFGHVPARREAPEPEVNAAALKTAIADTMAGRPVDVMALLDHAEATRAADGLERFRAEQDRILTARDAALKSSESPTRDAAALKHQENLAMLHEQAGRLREDLGNLQRRDVADTLAPEGRERYQEIQDELATPIAGTQRAFLEAERADLIKNGTRDPAQQPGYKDAFGQSVPAKVDQLEVGRSEAETHAHQIALDRVETQIRTTEDRLEKLRDAGDEADRALRFSLLKLESREQVLQSLMEREVRRYGASIGAWPGRDSEIPRQAAREIRLAQPGTEARDTIALHLNNIAKGSAREDVEAAFARRASGDPIAPLRQEAATIAKDAAETRMNPPADPAIKQAEQRNRATIESAPKLEGDATKQLAELEALHKDVMAEYDAMVASGRIVETEESKAFFAAADEAEKLGKAEADYAACAVDRGII